MSSNPAPSAPPPYAPQGGEGEPTPQYAQPPYGQQPPPQQPYQYPVQNIGYAQAQAGYGYPPGYPPQQYPQYAPAYPAQPGYAYPQAYPAQPVAQMAYGAQQPYYPPQPYQGVGVVAVNPNQVQYSTTFVRSMFAASLIGLILVAVMLGAPGWYQYSQSGGDSKVGLFSACYSYGGYSSCGSICDSSNKNSTCDKIRALRAFVILGLVILALYTILRFMLACSGNMALPSKGRRQFQLCASIGGLLAFIVSIAIAGALFKDFTDYSPSYCFFLCIINIGLTFSFVVNDLRLTRMP